MCVSREGALVEVRWMGRTGTGGWIMEVRNSERTRYGKHVRGCGVESENL